MFSVRWDDSKPARLPADRTRGAVSLSVGGRRIWPRQGVDSEAIMWTWSGLLENLSTFWPWIRFEESPPLGLDGPLMELEAAARARWHNADVDVDAEEVELRSFLDAHDLARCPGGIQPPSVRLLREGLKMRVAHADAEHLLSHAAVMDALTEFGDAISDRLAGSDEPSCLAVRAAWLGRDDIVPLDALRIATGMDSDDYDAAEFTAFGEISELSSVATSPLVAVARMSAAACSSDALAAVIAAVSQCRAGSVARLDLLAAASWSHLDPAAPGERPSAQGYRAARAVRLALGLRPAERIDVAQVLADRDVVIEDVELPEPRLDAVACWSDMHGPAVLINISSPAMASAAARRAALAHELCHLLIDRSGALPVAEVLGGRVSRAVEQRAKAFAAELLIPQAEVAQRFLGVEDAAAARYQLKSLASRFGASFEVIAWQARNALRDTLHPKARCLLRQFVPSGAIF